MKVLLNGQELKDIASEGATLGSVLHAVQMEKVGADEVIAAVWVDGEPLTAERLSEWKDRPAEDFVETHVEAPTRNQLAAQGLQLLADGLSQSDQVRLDIVERLGQGKAGEALELMAGYLQVWNGAQQTMSSVGRLLSLEMEGLEVYGQAEGAQRVLDLIERLMEQLQQLKTALEAQDMVLMRDILEYEFRPLTEEWLGMLEQLSQRFGEE